MAGEAMVKGSRSAYNGRIGLAGSQTIEAPLSGGKRVSGGKVKTGKDLRAGK